MLDLLYPATSIVTTSCFGILISALTPIALGKY